MKDKFKFYILYLICQSTCWRSSPHSLLHATRLRGNCTLSPYSSLEKNQYVYLQNRLVTSLQSCSLILHNGITLSDRRIKTKTSATAYCSPSPFPKEQAPAFRPICSLDYKLQETSENTSFLICTFFHKHQHARWLIDVLDCFLDCAIGHWLGCPVTEPGLARDMGTIEVRLIDWLIDWLIYAPSKYVCRLYRLCCVRTSCQTTTSRRGGGVFLKIPIH